MTNKKFVCIAMLILLFLIVYTFHGFTKSQGETLPLCQDCNVILISIDALRADHLGCYGYDRNTSPNIDKIAKEGIIFENHISQASWTVPSHASMFTSLYPFPLGLKNPVKLNNEHTTLAEIMKDNGYTTIAFTDGGYMTDEFGFNQGFDVFNDEGGGLAEINGRVSRWINSSQKRPFFLFIHTYDTHCLSKDKPSKPYRYMFDKEFEYNSSHYCGHVQDLTNVSGGELLYKNAIYDGAIYYTDVLIGDLFEELKKHGVYNKSIIIITSDHGEEIGDHGFFDHGHSLYDEIIHIPLIINYPDSKNAAKKRVKTITRNIDIMPTILDFLNISFNGNLEGRSILPDVLYSEFISDQAAISILWGHLITVRYKNTIISFDRLNSSYSSDLDKIKNENLSYSEDIIDGIMYITQKQYFYCKEEDFLMQIEAQKEVFNKTIKEIKPILDSISCDMFNGTKIQNVFLGDEQFEIIYDHIYSIRENNWKLIVSKNKQLELYNIMKDPYEKENLIKKERIVADRLMKKLYDLINSKKVNEESKDIFIQKKTLERLKSLGYIN